tara:strand:+ start:246 stop:1046 length:801 start_codon:yes stop_codon:yes gene_type:complete
MLAQQYMFNRYLDNLLGGFISITNGLLNHENYPEPKELKFHEFLFFASALNYAGDDFKITLQACIDLITDYRSISRAMRNSLAIQVRKDLVPEKFEGKKTDKRDYHNWANKIQQILSLLGQSPYFEYGLNKTIRFRTDSIGDGINPEQNRRRSQHERNQYYEVHGIEKQYGYELDHIYPLSWSDDATQSNKIDNHENLLYIDGHSHAIKTQQNNKYVILCEGSNNDLIYKSYDGNEIHLAYNTNVIYNPDRKQRMIKYNNGLNNMN